MLTTVEEVVDGIAVSEHDGIVTPLVAQDINQQTVTRTTGLALKTLISTHHLAHVTLLYQSLEGRQIGLPEVTVRGLHIHRVTQRLRTTVHGIVLGTGVGLEIAAVIALHTQNGLHTQHGIQIGILTAGFLTTTPTRITEDVHVRAPESQLRIAGIVRHTHGHIEQLRIVVIRTVPIGTGLIAHLREHIIHQLGIEGSCHTDGLRIDGIAALTHTVTGLAPPVVRGDAETVDRNRLVHHQSHLLLRCEQGE